MGRRGIRSVQAELAALVWLAVGDLPTPPPAREEESYPLLGGVSVHDMDEGKVGGIDRDPCLLLRLADHRPEKRLAAIHVTRYEPGIAVFIAGVEAPLQQDC